MKKVILALTLMFSMALTSCVACCDTIRAEERLPLASHKVALRSDFSKITNNIAVDIEFTQKDAVSATLICPTELKDFIVFNVSGNNLQLKLSEKLSQKERNEVNNTLRRSKSKLLLSAPNLTDIVVNGSCEFSLMSDLRTTSLNATLNGSGDINFNGVQCENSAVATVSGSGDIRFAREVKAKSVIMGVNGSGDIKSEIITAHNVTATVNGSGDMNINNVSAIETSFGVNGSGDMDLRNVICEKTSAAVNGSGDLKMFGACDDATYKIAASGDIRAKNMVAKSVVASVIGSGGITCNAQYTLSASVTGSGDVHYAGNPTVSTTTPKKVKVI